MTEFIYLASLKNRMISLQLIKSFSTLILSITNEETLYYLFSNNYINQIMLNDCDNHDEEFVSHYVNFLKSLISKLNSNTIQFFFHQSCNSFDLFTSALKLFNYPDPMVKNTVRNIFLGLLQLKYEPLYEYFVKLPAISYFSFISLSLKELIVKLNKEILTTDDSFSQLLYVQDDILIDILFIDDIFSLNISKISAILINTLFHFIILPLLANAIVSEAKPVISISTSIYVIDLLFKHIKYEPFLNCLYALCFFPRISKELSLHFKDSSNDDLSYFENNWSNQMKAWTLSYADYISNNFSVPFIKSLINGASANALDEFTEFKEIRSQFSSSAKSHSSINSTDSLNPLIIDLILKPFSEEKKSEMLSFHREISLSSGLNVGINLGTDDYTEASFTNLMQNLFLAVQQEKLLVSKYDDGLSNNFSNDHPLSKLNLVDNEIRKNLLSFLTSKDDSLILLVSTLIHITHIKQINQKLQSFAGLLQGKYHSACQIDSIQIISDAFIHHNLKDSTESTEKQNNGKIDSDTESQLLLQGSLPTEINNKIEILKNESCSLKLAGNLFDNAYFSEKLKEFDQISYDEKIADLILDVS